MVCRSATDSEHRLIDSVVYVMTRRQVRSKALAVAEALIKQTGNVDWKNFFIDNAGELEAVVGDAKAVVRDKAVKILRLIGIQTTATTAAQQAVPQPEEEASGVSSPGGGRDLLDLGDDGDVSSSSAAVGTPQQQGLDLFAGTSVSPQRLPEPATAPAAPPLDLFTVVDAAPMPAPPPQHAQLATPPRAPPTASASPGSLDLFSDVAVKPSPERREPVAPPTSLFGDLSLTSQATAQPAQAAMLEASQPPPSSLSADRVDLISIDEPLVKNVSPINVFDPLAGRRAGAAPPPGQAMPPPPHNPHDLTALGLGVAAPYGRAPSMGPPQGRMGPPFVPGGALSAGVAPTNLGKMGQGMIPALQPRTIIPSAEEDQAGSSAFSFIGGQSAASAGASKPGAVNEDAFSFVKDAMRTS